MGDVRCRVATGQGPETEREDDLRPPPAEHVLRPGYRLPVNLADVLAEAERLPTRLEFRMRRVSGAYEIDD